MFEDDSEKSYTAHTVRSKNWDDFFSNCFVLLCAECQLFAVTSSGPNAWFTNQTKVACRKKFLFENYDNWIWSVVCYYLPSISYAFLTNIVRNSTVIKMKSPEKRSSVWDLLRSDLRLPKIVPILSEMVSSFFGTYCNCSAKKYVRDMRQKHSFCPSVQSIFEAVLCHLGAIHQLYLRNIWIFYSRGPTT